MSKEKTSKISLREIFFNVLGFLIGILIIYFFPNILLFPISMLICKLVCVFAKSKALDWGCIGLGTVYIIVGWWVSISESIGESGVAGLIVILGLLPETLIMVFATCFAAKIIE